MKLPIKATLKRVAFPVRGCKVDINGPRTLQSAVLVKNVCGLLDGQDVKEGISHNKLHKLGGNGGNHKLNYYQHPLQIRDPYRLFTA